MRDVPPLGGRAESMRIALLTLVLTALAGSALAQDEPPERVSNDRPDRPIQMPAASSETKEAFDDFARFARRAVWERATKALYAIPEAQAARFVDGENGFIISVARKRREVLAGLSPEGQAAYRLFYDSEAKKILDGAEGAAERATLERVFSSYFLTSVGDNAADRLGDLYFEKGEFDRAADCWLAILRERPDSELSPALLTAKAAMALARAGRLPELDSLRSDLGARYTDESVILGGRKTRVSDVLRGLPSPDASEASARSSSAKDEGGPAPAPEGKPLWQMRFAASITAGMTPLELNQWERTAASGAMPSVAIDGDRLVANYLGHVFALDLPGGKLLWRTSSFHNIDQMASQNPGGMSGTSKFAILAADGYTWSLGRDPKDMNYNAAARLVCRRIETGEVVWQSQDLPDYSGLELVGEPILARGTLFAAARGSTSQSPNTMSYYGGDAGRKEYAVAIRPHDGRLLWKGEIGTIREGQRYYYYGWSDSTPQPRLVHRAGHLYVDTQQGVLARVDADSGSVDWGYGYETDPVHASMGRRLFVINGMLVEEGVTSSTPSPLLLAGDSLIVKGAKSGLIAAIDPDRMKLLWERPIAKTSRLLAADERAIYLGGADLEAIDRKDRKLLWSIPLPPGGEAGRALVRPDGLWQLTARGVFEVDPRSGRVRGIFRGDDPGAAGGDLALTDRLLLTISNKAISAYPRAAGPGDKTARGVAASPETRGSDD